MYLLNEYLLSIYNVPSAILGIREAEVDKTLFLFPWNLYHNVIGLHTLPTRRKFIIFNHSLIVHFFNLVVYQILLISTASSIPINQNLGEGLGNSSFK